MTPQHAIVNHMPQASFTAENGPPVVTLQIFQIAGGHSLVHPIRFRSVPAFC
jgi:hypothetical protein